MALRKLRAASDRWRGVKVGRANAQVDACAASRRAYGTGTWLLTFGGAYLTI